MVPLKQARDTPSAAPDLLAENIQGISLRDTVLRGLRDSMPANAQSIKCKHFCYSHTSSMAGMRLPESPAIETSASCGTGFELPILWACCAMQPPIIIKSCGFIGLAAKQKCLGGAQ